jgi:hypothetical protein
MLTALSVARDSSIVGQNDKIALITVLPPTDHHSAQLQYSFDDGMTNAEKNLSVRSDFLPFSFGSVFMRCRHMSMMCIIGTDLAY